MSAPGAGGGGFFSKMGGYKAMKPAPDAAQFEPSHITAGKELPKKVDLRPFMTAVEDQGQTSSCVANAVAGSWEYWIKRSTQQDHDVSRLFIYYNARMRAGDPDKDEGSVIQLAMEGLGAFGACSEQHWPFQPHLVTRKPNGKSYQEAKQFCVDDMKQVPLNLTAWKQSLAEGLPIVFGCVLFDSFDECCENGGVVPMPHPEELTRKEHGGHSMCCVGYSDAEGVFIVRNSWGTEWGDQGYCYMPYNYLMNDKFNDGDCWVFQPKTGLVNAEEAWSNSEAPVTDSGRGVSFIINAFATDAYDHVNVDLHEAHTFDWLHLVPEDFTHSVQHVENENFDFFGDHTAESVMASIEEGVATETLAESVEAGVAEESEETEESEQSEESEEEEESESEEEASAEGEESEEEEASAEGEESEEEEESEESEETDEEEESEESEESEDEEESEESEESDKEEDSEESEESDEEEDSEESEESDEEEDSEESEESEESR